MRLAVTDADLCVLQVLPSLVTGGVERGTVDMAEALVAVGARAVVASEGGPMTHQLARVGAEHLTLPLASKNPLIMRANIARLAAAIETHRVDIVHARSRAPAWSAIAAARRTGCAFVTTFHGTYGIGNELKRRYNAVMTKGDLVIAISNFIAEHIVGNYGVDPARLRVVPRGVDLELFDPARVSSERIIALARRFRLPDGVPVILLPGRLTRWKGQALLLEALPALAELDFRCLFVGSDQGRKAYRRELEAQIDRLGLAGRAAILDECNDMPAAYMLADVVVSASTEPEAFGRVVAEAQAMGRPLVASDHGGGREQMIPGVTAFPFPPGQAEGLTGVLRQALALDARARRRLGECAVAHVRANYSKALMCRRTLEVYAELPRRGRRAAEASLREAVSARSGA
jgi:glycosyltransferase involved in cell wall biosynthesis